MKTTVEVKILGQKFKISSDSDEHHVRRLAEYVNAKLDEIKGGAKAVPMQNLLILGALNIADEYFRFRDEKNTQIEKVTQKVKRLIEIIDDSQ